MARSSNKWIAPFCFTWLAFIAASVAGQQPQPPPTPKVLDPRLKIELFAQEPQIVTPVGVVVDTRGRVLVIESHTHFRPANYQGPPADRIRRFADTDGDGRADRIDTVYEGTRASMGLAFEPDGSLLVVTRDELFRLSDMAGDAKQHKKTSLATVVTTEKYPHNGLDGVALDAQGNIYLSMGENMGAPFKVVGSDGTTLAADGDGGSIYRLRPDGSGLKRWATGFWNPFHLAFDPLGRLFAVDNDPDSRPPCRLLHIVEGGDYGFRMRNGRQGRHPHTAWFGELPGTLGIVAGTGEAPSGIVVYESNNLPSEYRGNLLVTSWGNHLLERFELQPRGATFQGVGHPVVVGNEQFRPVGIAVAPDGSIYMTDWVKASYELHGNGRIWHLCSVEKAKHRPAAEPKAKLNPPEVRAAALRSLDAAAHLDEAMQGLADDDPWIRQAARTAMLRSLSADQILKLGLPQNATQRLEVALLLRDCGDSRAAELLPKLLTDDDPQVRLLAVQWIGEAGLKQYREQVLARLKAGDDSGRMFESILATLDRLEGGKPAFFERRMEQFAARLLRTKDLPPSVVARVLRYLPPGDKSLSLDRLEKLLADPAVEVRMEVVRSLRDSNRPERLGLLCRVASDEQLPVELRAEAVSGLSASTPDGRQMLFALAAGPQRELRNEAIRCLRGATLSAQEREKLEAASASDATSRSLVARLFSPAWKPAGRPDPQKPALWVDRTAGGDAAAGERLFFHPQGPRCAACHCINGRGGRVGPDLSGCGQMGAQRLLESILAPSREIAPQFLNWSLLLNDGRTVTGVLVTEQGNGQREYADAEGKLQSIHRDQIDEARPLAVSVMPDGLADQMTDGELRDLVAYLLKCR